LILFYTTKRTTGRDKQEEDDEQGKEENQKERLQLTNKPVFSFNKSSYFIINS
jgi:hypothetical protein